MRGRFRRRASPIADLDVTAFINLMVVLVAFFLSSVTYFKFSSLELNIPPASTGDADRKAPLELEIIIRKDALEVNNRRGGLIRRLPQQDKRYDYPALGALLKELKANCGQTRRRDPLRNRDTLRHADQDHGCRALLRRRRARR